MQKVKFEKILEFKNLIYFALAGLIVILSLSLQPVQNELKTILGLGYNENITLNNQDEDIQIETAKVLRVVDGDTVKLDNGDTVRYLYIDTPETKKPGESKKCYGLEATKANQKLVQNQQVWLIPDKSDTDRYQRKLRLIFLSPKDIDTPEKSVNAILVKNGFARSTFYKPDVTHQDLFLEIQTSAQQNQVGIWGKCENPFTE